MMKTGVTETFAVCHLYRLLWPLSFSQSGRAGWNAIKYLVVKLH